MNIFITTFKWKWNYRNFACYYSFYTPWSSEQRVMKKRRKQNNCDECDVRCVVVCMRYHWYVVNLVCVYRAAIYDYGSESPPSDGINGIWLIWSVWVFAWQVSCLSTLRPHGSINLGLPSSILIQYCAYLITPKDSMFIYTFYANIDEDKYANGNF